jgi:hypothetical protein
MELLFEYLTIERGLDPNATAKAMWRDYQRGGRNDKPKFLKEFLVNDEATVAVTQRSAVPKRQARHAAGVLKAQEAD